MHQLTRLIAIMVACVPASLALSADKPVAPLDKTLATLSNLIGGVWTNDDPKFKIEFRYDWVFGKSAIRGLGVIDKDGPNQTLAEATIGWDPANKSVYYLDFHGSKSVFKGTIKPEGDELLFEFDSIVGTPGRWRSVAKFPKPDEYQFTILGEKEGKWTPVVSQTLKRRDEKVSEERRQVTEGIVDASRDAVWAAWTTKKGQESWNVAHSNIDLKVGGKMLAQYDAKGAIGDPNTIENIILAFEPNRMIAIQVGKPPEKFPFKEAIKSVWHVLTFEDAGPGRTRVRIVGLGYGNDDESKKMHAFFEQGNAFTMKKLQEHFAK